MNSVDRILKLLNKKYDRKLEKQDSYQTMYKELTILANEYGIVLEYSGDFICLQYEILYHSLCNKIKFEETFLKTYVMMHDYWNDLDYLERKHQVNVDVDQMKGDLIHFVYQDEVIYLPIFDEKMNRMYHHEMVLFDLKQYGKLRREFKQYIKLNRYGIELWKSDFTRAEFVREWDSMYCLYVRELNRFYIIEDDQCIDTISLDPTANELDHEQLILISQLYEKKDAQSLIEFIINEKLIQDKLVKKFERYLKKLQKKNKTEIK